jgi:hypothetical protein
MRPVSVEVISRVLEPGQTVYRSVNGGGGAHAISTVVTIRLFDAV